MGRAHHTCFDANTVVASGWGNLVGHLETVAGEIHWSNGTDPSGLAEYVWPWDSDASFSIRQNLDSLSETIREHPVISAGAGLHIVHGAAEAALDAAHEIESKLRTPIYHPIPRSLRRHGLFDFRPTLPAGLFPPTTYSEFKKGNSEYSTTPLETYQDANKILEDAAVTATFLIPGGEGEGAATKTFAESAAGRVTSDVAAKGARTDPLTRGQRLTEYFKRLGKQPASRTAEETLGRVGRTLEEVEDALSGIPKKTPPPPPKMPDGRMYPPQADHITRNPNGSISASTAGHRIEIGADGSITIKNIETGQIDFHQRGAGGGK